MSNYFEVKVKYVKIDENGKEKKVSEPYLVDAVSFTEAEARIHIELEKMIHGDFILTNISKSNISELFPNENGTIWYKAKVRYSTVDEENSEEKKVTEAYLFDAVSFTEAESRAIEEFEKIIHYDLIIHNIGKSNISELVPNENGTIWYKAKVRYSTVDEENGKEKKAINYVLVQANSVDDAYSVLTDYLSDMIIPFEIHSVSESPILEVFPYLEKNN